MITKQREETLHDVFVESEGDGEYFIEFSLIDSLANARYFNDMPLIARMIGGSYEVITWRDIPMYRFKTWARDVTDFEHDLSSFAHVVVGLAHQTYDSSHDRSWVGVISELRLYPPGEDPLKATDDYGAGEMCGYETTEYHKPHPIAPYFPPERPETSALIGKLIGVRMRVRRSEDVVTT